MFAIQKNEPRNYCQNAFRFYCFAKITTDCCNSGLVFISNEQNAWLNISNSTTKQNHNIHKTITKAEYYMFQVTIFWNVLCLFCCSSPPGRTSSPDSPPTPPTVKLRKKPSNSRFTPLLTTMSMDGAGSDARHDISPKEHKPVDLRVALHRTQSLPPRSRPPVPKLELPSKCSKCLLTHCLIRSSRPGCRNVDVWNRLGPRIVVQC